MHRNSQKRYYIPGAAYFITTVTHGRYPYFEAELFRDIAMEDLRHCMRIKCCELFAFAIMPDHVHVLFRPISVWNCSQVMQNFKRTSSLHINQIILSCEGVINDCDGANGFPEGVNEFPEGANIYSRLRGRGYEKLRWTDGLSRQRERYAAQFPDRPYPPFKWQKSYHDHVIRDRVDFYRHMGYIKRQREKHGACGDIWVEDGL